ncbi:hypothetical protein KM868_11875 [Micrococcus luteus]|uniref:zonular occludens toxin domain-containing protein n=1 Tax=Micrococcus luteus TaxID=1270 RepID=UPI001C213B46|nr:zonular occludens toxin domain-containing protein [Micrococcus luteus]MBU8764190.1 hypothetical protein [Micrococcus luteus]
MAFVIGITGGYGTGKSTTGVIKAQQWAAASGAKLFSNFPMRGAFLFDHFTDWYRVAAVHGSIIVFDESQRNFDGRQWGAAGNITQSQIINYVRKMNCLLIFILPSYENIDTRIRQVTDVLIHCHKSQGGTIFNYIYDYQDKNFGEWGRLTNQWVLPPHSQKKVYGLNLFDTHSMIQKFPMPYGEKQTIEFFEELDRIHEEALSRYGLKVEIDILAKEELEFYAS